MIQRISVSIHVFHIIYPSYVLHVFLQSSSDAKYLLKFLRVSKFSQLVAREKLEKWISALDIIGEWLRDIDFNDPKYMEFFDTG